MKILKIIFCTTVVVFAVLPLTVLAMRGASSSPFKGVMTFDATPITIELGQYNYAIPAHYFDSQPDFDCNQKTALLTFLLPDFIGRSKENNAQFMEVGWFRPRGQMLISAEGNPTSGWTVEQSMAGRFKNLVQREIVREQLKPKTRHPFLGLDYYPTDKDIVPTDVLVQQADSGDVKTIISCSAFGSVQSPTCIHHFTDHDLILQMTYSRRFLDQWDVIEKNAHTWLAIMRREKIENPKPACDETFKG